MRRNEGLIIGTLALGALMSGAVGCGEEPVPTVVTYQEHIKPLMAAHCIRCHGAGGMFNADPDSAPVILPGSPAPAADAGAAPVRGDFTMLNSVGAKPGLLFYAAPNDAGIGLMQAFLAVMPPAPAPPLTDRERNMLLQWIQNPLITKP
jgi:hypothetical protein